MHQRTHVRIKRLTINKIEYSIQVAKPIVLFMIFYKVIKTVFSPKRNIKGKDDVVLLRSKFFDQPHLS